jgi:hypothetical protein
MKHIALIAWDRIHEWDCGVEGNALNCIPG